MTILFLVTALANAIWQPALLAAITWLALRLSRCSNATTRHAVWTIALVASVIVPVVSALPVLRESAPTTTATIVHTVMPKHVSEHSVGGRAVTTPPIAMRRPQFSIPQTFAFWLAIAWGVATLAILARLAVSFFYLERLKHDALPFPVDRRNLLARWDQAEKGHRDVRICVSSEISVPIAVGIFDAMILLPADLVDELESHDLDRILLHELAHVRRADDWVNLFERIALAAMFFSPGIYWIARQMDLEREVACDDSVLAQAAENVPYARCLAHIVEITQWPYRAMAAPGVFVTRKSMSIRIERLLARGRDVRVRLALVPSLVSLVAIVAIVVAGGFVSPTIAYTLDQAIPAPHLVAKATANPKAQVHVRDLTVAPSTLVSQKTTFVYGKTTVTTGKATFNMALPAASRTAAVRTQAPQRTPPPDVVADNGGYLDDLANAGFTHLTPEEVIEMKSVGVTGEYIRAMRNAGLSDVSARTLVELKSVGVTPEYIAQMRRDGLTAQSAREWSELKSVGVTPEYVAAMRSSGIEGQDVRGWVELKSVGVTSEYVSDLSRAGYSHLSTREYVELRSMGIDGSYIAGLAKHGFTHLSVHQLVEYKSMGIDK
jgi:beta-lactamase regulating signal transducer with metallopeptidase domain